MSSIDTRYILRPLENRDIDVLAVFLTPLLPGDWSAAKLQELLQSSHCLRVLDTEAGSGLIGFAEFQQVLDEGHLLNIAIAPLWQGRGLGQALLAGVLADMRKLGCTRCLLEVRRSNERAQHLYERAGFTLDGVRKNYYPPLQNGGLSEDALLYSLSSGLLS